MSAIFQRNEAVAERRDLFVQMIDAVDLVTPRTGLVLAVQIVKAGQAAYADAAETWVEIGAGTYRIRLAAADLDTPGTAMLRIAAEGAATQFVPIQVAEFPGEIHLAKAALANARRHTIDTGVNEILDDDGATVLRTLTPSETDGLITLTAS